MVRLKLLGPGLLTLEDRVVRPHSAKSLALLAFLAVESNRAHAREKLAGLLWGSAASGRQSLRQALYSLNSIAEGRLGRCLQGDREVVSFAPDPGLEVDVHTFLAGVGGTGPQEWEAAAAAYRAPLLDGKAFDDCEAFMAWLAAARERLHALAARNYERLVVERMTHADWDGALRHAEAWRDFDPASEGASRQLIRIHGARREPHAIQAEWSRLCRVLERELQAAPARETAELVQALGLASEASPRADPSEVESFLRAARAAERVYAFGSAAELYERALQALRCSPDSRMRCCDVLLCREAVLERLGRRAEQAGAIREAVMLAQSLGDDARLAAALLRHAGASAYLGERVEALRAAQQALGIYRALGDGPAEAEALRELGFVHWRAEDYANALECAREALALHRRLGDVAGEASALHNLAEIHRGLGSPRQALEWYEQALERHWAVRNHEGEILTLFGMANALQQAGDAGRSGEKYALALKLSERHGERTMEARALHALAMQAADKGDLDRALPVMRRAVEVDRAIGYAHALGHDLLDLSYVHALRGEQVESRAALQEALVWFRYTENHDAAERARAWLDAAVSRQGAVPSPGTRRWVKSHLPLGEGKVYCEFESPLAGMRRSAA